MSLIVNMFLLFPPCLKCCLALLSVSSRVCGSITFVPTCLLPSNAFHVIYSNVYSFLQLIFMLSFLSEYCLRCRKPGPPTRFRFDIRFKENCLFTLFLHITFRFPVLVSNGKFFYQQFHCSFECITVCCRYNKFSP